MSFLTDCATLPAHIEQECNNYKKGGFPSFAVVDKDSTVVGDWSNSTLWLSQIALGKIQVANRVKFNIPDPSPQKSDNPVACGAVQILDGFDWKLEGLDANVSTLNNSFYTTLNKKDAYFVMWNKDQSEILVIDKPVTFMAHPIFPASNREHQTYKIEGEWSSGKDWFPTAYTQPTGVFTL